MNLNGYWKSINLDGTVRHLYKIENDTEVYRFVSGEWVLVENMLHKFGWDDDFDDISDEEAEEIMKGLTE